MGIANMETRAAEIGGRVSIAGRSTGTEVALVVPVPNPAWRSAKWGVAVSVLALLHYLTFALLIGDRIRLWQVLLFASTGVSAAVLLRSCGQIRDGQGRFWVRS